MKTKRILPIFALVFIFAGVNSVNAATQLSTTNVDSIFAVVMENDEVRATIVPKRGWRIVKYEIKQTGNNVLANDESGDTDAEKHKPIGDEPDNPEETDLVWNENYPGTEDRFTNIGEYKGDVEWRPWVFGESSFTSMIIKNNSEIVQVYNYVEDFLGPDKEGKTWIDGARLYKVYTLVNGSNAIRMDYKLVIGDNGFADLVWAFKAQLALGGGVDDGDILAIDGSFYRHWAGGPKNNVQAERKYDWPATGLTEYHSGNDIPDWTGTGPADQSSADFDKETDEGHMKAYVKSEAKYAAAFDPNTDEYTMVTLPYKAMKVDSSGNSEYITFAQYFGVWMTYNDEYEPLQYNLEAATTAADVAGEAKSNSLPIIKLEEQETLYWTAYFSAGKDSSLDISTTTIGDISGNASLQTMYDNIMSKYLTSGYTINTIPEWGLNDPNDPSENTNSAEISPEEKNISESSDSGFLGICGPTILLGLIAGPLALAAKKMKK